MAIKELLKEERGNSLRMKRDYRRALLAKFPPPRKNRFLSTLRREHLDTLGSPCHTDDYQDPNSPNSALAHPGYVLIQGLPPSPQTRWAL